MLLVQKCCLPHYPTWDPREGSSVLKLNIITGDISKTSNKTCQGHLSLWQVLRVLWKISPCYPEPHIPCAHHQGGRSGLPLESPSTQQSYPYRHKTVARGFKSSPCWNMLGHSWEGGGGVLKILTSVKQLVYLSRTELTHPASSLGMWVLRQPPLHGHCGPAMVLLLLLWNIL